MSLTFMPTPGGNLGELRGAGANPPFRFPTGCGTWLR